MLSKLIDRLQEFFKSEDQEVELTTPKDSFAKFELNFQDLLIGTLEHQNGRWFFAYSEAFKAQDRIRPIVDFPDKQKIYHSEGLFPFFSSRIPSLQRLKIQKIVAPDFTMDEVGLLKKFGKQSIANPYQLVPGD